MGSDSFHNLPKWKNYNYILKNYPIYIYTRAGHEKLPDYKDAIINVINAPLLPISATEIRKNIKLINLKIKKS